MASRPARKSHTTTQHNSAMVRRNRASQKHEREGRNQNWLGEERLSRKWHKMAAEQQEFAGKDGFQAEEVRKVKSSRQERVAPSKR